MDEAELTHLLRDARRSTLAVFEDLEGEQLMGPDVLHHLEPALWEMGHVAWFQEYWILRRLDGRAPIDPRFDKIYDAFHVSYKLRRKHDLPTKVDTLGYAERVLDACVSRLAGKTPTPDDAYFTQLVTLHEGMHAENMLAVRQALGYPRPPTFSRETLASEGRACDAHDVHMPGGSFRLGAERDQPFVFDNEKWAHPVEIESFSIAALPVTQGEYAGFVDAGGYAARRFWDKRGWQWRRREQVQLPFAWERRDGTWHERVFDEVVPLRTQHPMCHVNVHEARAYCRFAARRLPTEAEWEMAASWDPAAGVKRLYPWGQDAPDSTRANLDATRGGTIDVRLLPAGDAPTGCRQMIGNVWEWVDDLLEPYPGFERDPYAEYSEPYFGQKPVLRGGCFATRSRLIRNTWRNFFIRHRRSIYAGFRTCAP